MPWLLPYPTPLPWPASSLDTHERLACFTVSVGIRQKHRHGSVLLRFQSGLKTDALLLLGWGRRILDGPAVTGTYPSTLSQAVALTAILSQF